MAKGTGRVNILLVGESAEYTERLKTLLELAFPQSKIILSDYRTSSKKIRDYCDEWNLVIFLPFTKDKNLELLTACREVGLPALCFVARDSTDTDFNNLIRHGAKGIVGHNASLNTLRNGIQFINEGGLYLDPKVTKRVNLFSNNSIHRGFPKLTKRQWQVFQLVAKGLTLDEIANSLSIKKTTVLAHQKGILYSTNSKTISGAIAKGVFYGWIKEI